MCGVSAGVLVRMKSLDESEEDVMTLPIEEPYSHNGVATLLRFRDSLGHTWWAIKSSLWDEWTFCYDVYDRTGRHASPIYRVAQTFN